MAKKKATKKKGSRKGRARSKRQPPVERPLTAKQQRFVEEYLVDSNGAQAAIRAGYAPRYADRQASDLLGNPRVQAAVEAGRRRLADKADIEALDVVREWARLGTSDIRDLVEVKGGAVVVKPSAEWSDNAARAVVEVTETVTENGGTIKLKLHPKLGALDSLGKMLRLLVDRRKVEHTGKDGGPIQVQQDDEDLSALTDEELDALEEIRDKLDAAKRGSGGEPSSD